MKNTLILLLVFFVAVSCVTQTARQAEGTFVGLELGSRIGGAIGCISSDNPRAALAGTAIGAVAGALIGNRVNRPKETGDEQSDGFDDTIDEESVLESVELRNVTLSDSCRIVSGGEVQFSFELVNRSGCAVDICALVECGSRRIAVSPIEPSGSVAPDEGVRYTVTLRAIKKLSKGECNVDIFVSVDAAPYILMHSQKILTDK